MLVEQLSKGINEKLAPSVQNIESRFSDSERTSEIELPSSFRGAENLSEVYADSKRDVSDGPQWNENNLRHNRELETQSEIYSELIEGKSENSNEYKDSSTLENTKDSRHLTEEQRKDIKERTEWPDEIIESIGSWEEYEIYDQANLIVAEINGKPCLVKKEIDLSQKDADGISNQERMERGRPPLTKDGQEVELHHIGQKPDAPLAELTKQEHRGVGNDAILHDKNKESEIDRNEFAKERKHHWKSRVSEGV